jgi:hypothetical protein
LPEGTSQDLSNMVKFILQKNFKKRPSMKEIITSKTFISHARRLGLEGDLNDVLSLQRSSTINSTTSSGNKGMNNLKLNKMQKKLQKNENNKSSKLFINEEKTSKNKVKKDNGTDRKVDKIETKNVNNSREKIKIELNSIELNSRKNARVKTREKKNNKNNIYVSVNNYSSNNNQGINIDINPKNILNLSPSIKDKSCSNSPTNEIIKRKNQLNDSNSDIISTSEFINVLEKTKKSRTNNITLNDLFNFQFSNDDNKILDSTSSTTSLLK